MATKRKMQIREFQPGDEAAFQRLNEEWITKYFAIEDSDRETFADPVGKIVARGGRIFMVLCKGVPAGCCALLRLREGEFEVGKMAVAPAYQGAGVGRTMLEVVIEAARDSGAHRLYLETNHVLTAAIALYESAGFVRLPAEATAGSAYARADVAMELLLR